MNGTELMESIEQEDIEIVNKLARKHRFKIRVIAAVVVAILLLAAIAAAWIAGNTKGKDTSAELIEDYLKQISELKKINDNLKNNPIVVSPVAPEIVLDELYSEINDIGELATVEYFFTDAARYSDSRQIKNWNIPLTEKSFTLKWDGKIKAGIDVAKVVIEVNETDKIITVKVPKAMILSYEIDNDSVEILDEKDNIFNNISVDDKVQFDGKTEESMKERAIENGLLEKAQTNAEVIISGLIMSNPAVTNEYNLDFIVVE